MLYWFLYVLLLPPQITMSSKPSIELLRLLSVRPSSTLSGCNWNLMSPSTVCWTPSPPLKIDTSLNKKKMTLTTEISRIHATPTSLSSTRILHPQSRPVSNMKPSLKDSSIPNVKSSWPSSTRRPKSLYLWIKR